MKCDLCEKEIPEGEAEPIPYKMIELKVRMKKFNPFATPGIDMSRVRQLAVAMGIPESKLYESWKEQLNAEYRLDTNPDWTLCPACVKAFLSS